MARTIQVVELVDELSYLDATGTEQELGTIISEVYGADEAKKFTFKPSASNPFAQKGKSEEGYALGIGTSHLQFINPAVAQRAALKRGLQIKDVIAYKGGLQMKTQFIDPEKRWDDALGYDLEFWERQRRKPGELFAMIQLDTNLKIGHMAARYAQGIWRQICTNGLTSTILELPALAIRHTDWETDDIEGQLDDIELGTGIVMDAMRKGLTTMKFLGVAERLLERVKTEAASPTGLTQEMVFLKDRFPTITTSRGRFFDNYLEQLGLLLGSYAPHEPVQGIHILNAYTNAISVERMRGSDRGAFDALDNMNNIVAETVSLANMAAIFN